MNCKVPPPDPMQGKAEAAAAFISGLANPHRLRILCHLSEGEKSVSELIALTSIAQTSMSMHLGKLKDESIVTFRRDHRVLYYRICNKAVLDVMAVLHAHFCVPDADLGVSNHER